MIENLGATLVSLVWFVVEGGGRKCKSVAVFGVCRINLIR